MTSTNTSDFDPAVRNAAWWSGDSRMAVNGKAAQAILIKQGKMEPPDLSEVEEVQMGKVMEPTIARLFQDKHRIELKDLDWIGQHSKETWLKAHGDYISADGKTLVECKNYNAASIKNFDEDGNVIPPADFVQLLHEAACFNVDNIYLAVLFGGQKFRTYHFTIAPEQKDELVQTMAKYWGMVQSGVAPEPDSIEAAKIVYPVADIDAVVATQAAEKAVAVLKEYKARIKHLETEAEKVELELRKYMGTAPALLTVDGHTLISWKNDKPGSKFDAKLFQKAMPDVYQKFVVETTGVRRFLLK